MFFNKKEESFADRGEKLRLRAQVAMYDELFKDIKDQLGLDGGYIFTAVKTLVDSDHEKHREIAQLKGSHALAVIDLKKQITNYKNKELEEQIKDDRYKISVGTQYPHGGDWGDVAYSVTKAYVEGGEIRHSLQGLFKEKIEAEHFIKECEELNDKEK